MASHILSSQPQTFLSVQNPSFPSLISVSLLPYSVFISSFCTIKKPNTLAAGSFRSMLNRIYAQTKREISSFESNFKSGVAVYKPKSYDVLVTDAARSLACGLQEGKNRIEIDFP